MELEASVSGPPSQLPNEANPFRQGSTPSTRGPLVVKLHNETRSTGELFDVVAFRLTSTGKLQSTGTANSPIHWRPLWKREDEWHKIMINYDITHSSNRNKKRWCAIVSSLCCWQRLLERFRTRKATGMQRWGTATSWPWYCLLLSSLTWSSFLSCWIYWDRSESLDSLPATEHVQTTVLRFLKLSSCGYYLRLVAGQRKKKKNTRTY